MAEYIEREARWDDDGRCTNCGRYMPFDCEGNAEESIYCPDCGAEMNLRWLYEEENT